MLKTRLFDIADVRGIRQTWIATQMDYSPEYLSRVKHGIVPISEEFQRRAQRLFADIAPEELFFEADDEHVHRSMVESIATGDKVTA